MQAGAEATTAIQCGSVPLPLDFFAPFAKNRVVQLAERPFLKCGFQRPLTILSFATVAQWI